MAATIVSSATYKARQTEKETERDKHRGRWREIETQTRRQIYNDWQSIRKLAKETNRLKDRRTDPMFRARASQSPPPCAVVAS